MKNPPKDDKLVLALAKAKVSKAGKKQPKKKPCKKEKTKRPIHSEKRSKDTKSPYKIS